MTRGEKEREKKREPTGFTIMPLRNLQLWERVVGAIIQYSKQYFYGHQKKRVQSKKIKNVMISCSIHLLKRLTPSSNEEAKMTGVNFACGNTGMLLWSRISQPLDTK